MSNSDGNQTVQRETDESNSRVSQSSRIIELKHLRGLINRKLTGFEKALNDLEATPDADFELLAISSRLAKHNSLWEEFEIVQNELDLLAGDNETLTAHENERYSFETRFFALNGRAQKLIKKFQSQCQINSVIGLDGSNNSEGSEKSAIQINLNNPSSIDNTGNSSSSNLQNSGFSGIASHHFLLYPNLPKLGLPSFSGTFNTWLGFRDTFTSMVHNNAQVPLIFKFHYLKSCVTGEAAEVIASLESSSENYAIAWKLLADRYDNRKFIAESHVRALFNIPSVSKDFSVRALLDKLHKHTRALTALDQPVDKWDLVLIHLIEDKLPNKLREKWEEFAGISKIPTINDLITFLERRSQIEINRSSTSQTNPSKNSKANDRSASSHGLNPPRAFATTMPSNAQTSQTPRLCPICNEEHSIYSCPKFLKFSPHERLTEARNASLCVNCLRGKHRPIDCRLKGCRQCHKRHNSLLHFEHQKKEDVVQSSPNPAASTSSYHLRVPSEVYLATAIVDILDSQGNYEPCRIMLDGGAQSCTIINTCASRLGLKRTPFEIPLLSLNDMQTKINFATSATFKSRFDNKKRKLELLIVNQIADSMPTMPLDKNYFPIPPNIFLADPKFYESAPIDIIIGAEFAYSFMLTGQLKIKGHSAVLQKTMLGWIIAGRVYNKSAKVLQGSTKMFFLNQREQLPLLWELDQVQPASKLSREEQSCETHFTQHVRRDDTGRYIVKLPFNQKISQLGNSRNRAFQRFYALEKKFEKNPSLKSQYSECVKSYLKEGHLSIADNQVTDEGYYLPHHAVIKETSLTTKTRVVFDGFAASSSGISLNDCLMVGPTVQEDLISIVIRFRSFLIAFTADMEQMYRQILVYPDDKKYQKIIWRANPDEPIKIYELNRVTFGTASAPFLATRTLQQLADDGREAHPIASQVLKRDFYVDDLLTGAQSIAEALTLRNELIALVRKGGFSLRKWGSNDSRLTQDFPKDFQNTHMSLDPTTTIKTLGLYWDPQSDSISYSVNLPNSEDRLTKRSILAQTSRLFDPLGLLGPVIVSAKILIQSLWKTKVGWDDPVPIDIQNLWSEFKLQLPVLNNIRFDRCISIPNTIETQLHGFSDASEKGYGTCLYLRSTNDQGRHHCALICAKSRVAPLTCITLPKLELCAAVLLTKLYCATVKSLQLQIDRTYFWSDSTITLSWIKTEPHMLKMFVANRVAEINAIAQPHEWFHVPTHENPADLISRGQGPKDFLQSKIWKNGPVWLSQDSSSWPKTKLREIELPEKRSVKPILSFNITISNSTNGKMNVIENLLERYSNLKTLKHVIAFCIRFINNIKTKLESNRVTGPLTNEEIDSAMSVIIKTTQSSSFSKEFSALSRGETLNKKSSLLCLNPFLDQGIIKVGGRLQNAEIPESKKHPIVLPRNHHVTTLIIREEHIKLNHAGAQATLYAVREMFWPVDGRNITRHIIHRCVKCFRAKPRGNDYLMGNLTEKRVSYSRPFLNSGAVHLELVSDLSTETFLGSLKRFFSRRGKASTIHSDNGRNFVGASREIKEFYQFLQSTENNEQVKNFLLDQKVSLHFIPPQSPHFGGLWEASVKSFKYHLKRTVGDTLLTYEQFQTFIIEIEAVLNSRPLTPMSSDPNDFLPLSPGHFLIGAPLTSFPQADYRDLRKNQLSSWQHAQQMRDHFWSRWYKEYLNEMITRSKLKKSVRQENIATGTLVVEKQDGLPPMCWKLARISQVFPGKDGIVRSVILRNSTGTYERCTKKLYPLPIYESLQ